MYPIGNLTKPFSNVNINFAKRFSKTQKIHFSEGVKFMENPTVSTLQLLDWLMSTFW